MRAIDKRLQSLEAVRPSRGVRIFTQAQDNEELYHEGEGQAFSAADISALARQGWQCIKIEYTDEQITDGLDLLVS